MFRNSLIFFILLFSFASLPVQGAQGPGPDPKLPRVVYGFDREFPPFSYENPGGQPTGFEIEVLEAALRGQANLFMRPLAWDQIAVELASGTINVTSGIIKTEQRVKNFGFSAQPSISLQIRFFTKIYNRVLNNSLLRGQPVAVDQGSYQQQVLNSFGGINIKPYPPKTAALRALYNDEVAAYCGLDKTTYYYINKLGYGSITTVGTPLGTVDMHFAVNRDRGDILRLVNSGMKTIIENGEYDRIYRRWFVRELTDEEKKAMVKAAFEAGVTAYAPYSKTLTGAAVLTATGKIYTGSAVENAEQKLNISAVRAAAARSVAEGELEIRAFVCVDQDGNILPVNHDDAQFMYEFGRSVIALARNASGAEETPMLTDILAAPKAPELPLPVVPE